MPRLTIKYLRMLYFIARINTKKKGKNSFSRMMTEQEIELAIKQCMDNGIDIKLKKIKI